MSAPPAANRKDDPAGVALERRKERTDETGRDERMIHRCEQNAVGLPPFEGPEPGGNRARLPVAPFPVDDDRPPEPGNLRKDLLLVRAEDDDDLPDARGGERVVDPLEEGRLPDLHERLRPPHAGGGTGCENDPRDRHYIVSAITDLQVCSRF